MSDLKDKEIAILKEENSILKERIEQFKTMLCPPELDFANIFGFSSTESALFTALIKAKGKTLSQENLINILYSMKANYGDLPELKIIDVFVCRIRKKLKDWNIRITTQWGRGYSIDRDSAIVALNTLGLTIADI